MFDKGLVATTWVREFLEGFLDGFDYSVKLHIGIEGFYISCD